MKSTLAKTRVKAGAEQSTLPVQLRKFWQVPDHAGAVTRSKQKMIDVGEA
jgi:hypothetical protein